MTPWWVTLIIGIGTAAVTIGGVVINSGQQQKRLRQQIQASSSTAQASQRGNDRAEWFRRVQWAQSLLGNPATQDAGLDVLRVLADSADDADVRLIRALVHNSPAVQESIELGDAGLTEGSADDDGLLAYEVQDEDTEITSSRGAPNA